MTTNDRRSEDGFDGRYPPSANDWVAQAYRDAGMEPPWLLEYEDGKVVGPKQPSEHPAPRHEA